MATNSIEAPSPVPDPVKLFYRIDDDVILWMELHQINDPDVLDPLQQHSSASPEDNFYIQLRERHFVWGEHNTSTSHEDCYRIVEEPIVSHWRNYDRLISGNDDLSAIFGLLDGIPTVMDRMPQWISSFARALSPVTCQQCGQVKRFLHVNVGLSYFESVILARAEREAMINMVTAHESAIQGLNKECLAVVDDHSSGYDQQCMICLDELSSGSEVSKLPCSHLYHWSCVVEWLKTSHFCPTCRYCFPIQVEREET